MKKFSRPQNLNYLAIEFLEKLGNKTPSQPQINLMESLISKVGIEQKISFDHKLSARETACLLLIAQGKTSDETAAMLGVKSSTIKTYHKKIKRKLACANLAQAVFQGIRYGYVQPATE
jgi:DNA-binding CsgD family transcriptional regulator